MRLRKSQKGILGICVVRDASGAFVRAITLNQGQLAAVENSRNGIPPGVSQAEWENEGITTLYGVDHDVGDCDALPDGTLRICLGWKVGTDPVLSPTRGDIIQDWVTLAQGEWDGIVPNVNARVAKPDKFTSLVDGELTEVAAIAQINNLRG